MPTQSGVCVSKIFRLISLGKFSGLGNLPPKGISLYLLTTTSLLVQRTVLDLVTLFPGLNY